MTSTPNYKKTLIACYLGFITQAILANFTPLLFLSFHREFNIPLGKISMISLTFYFTQLLIDGFCAGFVDKIGYRKSVVVSEILSSAGLLGLVFIPQILSNPFIGIIISVIIYAAGSGLIEVLCSPIIEACPFDNKSSVMSLLHSFYCWGSAGVILISSIFFSVFGIENWRIMACIWAVLPLLNVYNFLTCPIETLVEEEDKMGIKGLLKTPVFWVCIILMICAGASELSMAQWASAYAESALGLSKTVGDIFGPCMFAVTMGISRTLYGKYGDKMNLKKFMLFSGILCVICYLMAGISDSPVIGLIGCIMCGFSVGIMWPGAISISSSNLPNGGTALFAILAMAGDMGGSLGPTIVGNITEIANNNLHIGMLTSSVFPIILLICIIIMGKEKAK